VSRSVLIVPEALFATPAAAVVAALPAAVRLSGERGHLVEAWLVVAGLLCPIFAASIVATRAARRGFSVLPPESRTSLFVGAGLWALLSLPAMAALGAWLKAHTHHRGLGGATFALLALAACAMTALIAWRVTTGVLSRVRRDSTRGALALAIGLAALVFLVAAAARAALGDGVAPRPVGAERLAALLLDGGLAVVATAAAAALDLAPRRSSAALQLGAGATVFVLAVGVALAVRSPALRRDLHDRAPLASSVGQTIGLSGGASQTSQPPR
jgi:choline-sulfatase